MSSHHERVSNPPQTILVVDNLEEVRGVIGGWLARQGYRVAEAGGGDEAVEEALLVSKSRAVVRCTYLLSQDFSPAN